MHLHLKHISTVCLYTADNLFTLKLHCLRATYQFLFITDTLNTIKQTLIKEATASDCLEYLKRITYNSERQ